MPRHDDLVPLERPHAVEQARDVPAVQLSRVRRRANYHVQGHGEVTVMDERTEQAFVDTLRVVKEALQELQEAVKQHKAAITDLQARVEALERLRLPRPVPPPRSGR